MKQGRKNSKRKREHHEEENWVSWHCLQLVASKSLMMFSKMHIRNKFSIFFAEFPVNSRLHQLVHAKNL